MQAIMLLINENLTIFIIGLFVVMFILSRLSRLIDPILALIGLAMFIAFTGYMLLQVFNIDLAIVIVGTLILIAVDFVQTLRENDANNGA